MPEPGPEPEPSDDVEPHIFNPIFPKLSKWKRSLSVSKPKNTIKPYVNRESGLAAAWKVPATDPPLINGLAFPPIFSRSFGFNHHRVDQRRRAHGDAIAA